MWRLERLAGASVVVLVATLLAACDGAPAPGGPCSANQDCVPSELCLAGRCAPLGRGPSPCTHPGECSAGAFCHVETGECRPISGALDPKDAGPAVSDSGPADEDAGPRDAFEGLCDRDEQCGDPPVDICFALQCVKGCGEPDGLPCTGDTACNRMTGRCETPEKPCTTDFECSPPVSICEGGLCRPGCGLSMRCTGTGVCDPVDTGRCLETFDRCAVDADCRPPEFVCESGQCIRGCALVGGVVCEGGAACNPSTGRCR